MKKSLMAILCLSFCSVLYAMTTYHEPLSTELVVSVFFFASFFLDFILLYRFFSKFDLVRSLISIFLLNSISSFCLYAMLYWNINPTFNKILIGIGTIIALPSYALIPLIGREASMKLFKCFLVFTVAGVQMLLGVILFSIFVHYINRKQLSGWLFLSKIITSTLAYYFIFIY